LGIFAFKKSKRTTRDKRESLDGNAMSQKVVEGDREGGAVNCNLRLARVDHGEE
jgi:hypothetical protein